MTTRIPVGRRKKWLTLALILLATVVAAYLLFLVVSGRYWAKRYAQGYSQIQMGDPKERVVGLMGRPTETTGCDFEAFTDKKEEAKYKEMCKERYWYGVFLKDYVISLDKDGKVINKASAVSP